MHTGDIISKGQYVHSQFNDLVSVKQFIITKEKKKRTLFLRLSNDREDTLTSVSLRVRQYNAKGEFIGAKKVSCRNLKVESFGLFSLNMPISLNAKCIEFRVDIVEASFGEYIYNVIDGDAHVRYEKQEITQAKKVNIALLKKALGGKNHKVSTKTLRSPVLLTVMCSVILLILMSISIIQLARYMYVETSFTLNDFEYEFVTDNKLDGPIRLLRYKGDALNLVIPADIDGHLVNSIAPGAFSSVPLRSIVINGNTLLESEAFRDCRKLETVVLHNVEVIESYAFASCTNLKSISLGENLKTIGKYSFNACRSLENVIIPSGVESIDKYAFRECASLRYLEIPDTVQYIGEGIIQATELQTLVTPYIGSSSEEIMTIGYFFGHGSRFNDSVVLSNITVKQQTFIPDNTFYGCSELTKANFYADITEIGDSAFYGCSSLLTFDIDKTVTSIGKYAFYDCSSLDKIQIPDGIYKIEEGTFYNCRSLSHVNIPESVKRIYEEAFYNCRSITTLNVSNKVTSIGKNAFLNCSSLVNVNVPFIGSSSKESTTVSAFFGDGAVSSIQSLRITGPMTIVDSAFENMTSLCEIYINDDITVIGESAFAKCSSLNKLDLHENIESIGKRAFYGCSSLVSLELPEGLDEIGDSMFEGCSSLESINVPNSVLEIGKSAFKKCASIVELTLPDAISSIGKSAFAECVSLCSINIPKNVSKINTSTFENCGVLTTINIPSGVTEIKDKAFAGCALLANVTLSEQLEKIGASAFANCTSFTSVSIPASVTKIGAGVLEGCTAIQTLSVPFMTDTAESGESGKIGFLFDSKEGSNVSVPETLTSVSLLNSQMISDQAFENCSFITSVDLSDGVISIGERAFSNCSYLSKINFPKTIASVGKNAFENCSSITEATFSENLEYIDSYAFYNCTSLSSISFKEGMTWVGERAFENCYAIQTMELPTTVTSIGDAFLYGCYSVEKLSIPFLGASAGNSDSSIYYCFGESFPDNLRYINITNAQTIPNNAFDGLYNVLEINLNEGISSVGACAFYNCSSLRKLTIPSTVTYMGSEVLNGCYSLETLSIPFPGTEQNNDNFQALFGYSLPYALKNLTITADDEISSNVFFNCYSIENIIFESSLLSIEDYAFSYCTSLKNVVIPETLISIGKCAFYECINLRSITLPESINNIEEDAFYNCYKLSEVYDYTDFNLSKGDPSCGYVAYYAINIYKNGDTAQRVQDNGFTFIRDNKKDSEWYLVDYTLNNGICNLPSEFEYDDSTVFRYNIAPSLFRDDINLVEVNLSEAVQSIGKDSFYNCYNLTKANLSDSCINIVSESAFENCSCLENVYFPSSLETIEERAFFNCSLLKSVTLYENVSLIEDDAFWGCTSLREVYNLSQLDIAVDQYDNGAVSYYAFIVHDDLYDEPLTEVKIGDLIFMKSDNNWFLAGHTSENGELYLNSFWYNNRYIDSYSIPRNAFINCESIISITVSDAVKSINRDAFSYHYDIKTVDFGSNYSLTNSDISWLINQYQLKSIVFPTSLTEIPYDVIRNLWNLETVSFEGNYNIYTIPHSTFSGMGSLKNIILPGSISHVEDYAFNECSSLTSIDLANCSEIGNYAFYGCSSLVSVNLSDYLQSIGSCAFGYCHSLRNIDLSSSYLTYIPESAFISCVKLQSVYLSDQLVSIGMSAFEGCSSLSAITIPSTVTTIEDYAFSGCTNLYEVWNLSQLQIATEGISYGYVGYYAIVIHGANDSSLEYYEVEENNVTFKFALNPNTAKRYLVSIIDYTGNTLILPDTDAEYIVTRGASTYNGNSIYFSGILVPETVIEIKSGFFDNIYNTFTVYYKGTEAEWYNRFSNIYSSYTLYTYTECKHEYGNTWRYDSYGQPTTDLGPHDTREYVAADSTCYNPGTLYYICNKCGTILETEEIPMKTHTASNDGICIYCGDAMYSMSYSSPYTFDMNESGRYVSNNGGVNDSSAEMTFTAHAEMDITIEYSVSSEADCDVFYIMYNGQIANEVSGYTETLNVTLCLHANDTITFVYSKDEQGHSYDDNARIESILVRVLN